MVKSYKLSILDNREIDSSDTGELCRLPYFIIDELFTYGRVISIRDDDEKTAIDDLLSGVVNINKKIQSTLDTKFEKLMLELHLANQTKMLFYREDLSPEFFNQTGDLYNIFFKGEKSGDLATKIPVDDKLYEIIKLKYDNRYSKHNIHYLLSNGFILDSFIDLSNTAVNWIPVSALLYSGLFANVLFLAKEEDYNTVVPEYIRQAVMVAKATSKFSVEFI